MEELFQAPGEIALRPADEALLGEARIGLARERRGAAHRVELGVVLHRAQSLDEPAARDELDVARRERLPAAPGEILGLEPERPLEQLGQRRVQRALGLDELDPLDRPAELGVAEVAEQAHPVGLDDQGRVGAVEVDEVADVDEVRDDQRLFEARLQALETGHAARSARNSRASR